MRNDAALYNLARDISHEFGYDYKHPVTGRVSKVLTKKRKRKLNPCMMSGKDARLYRVRK